MLEVLRGIGAEQPLICADEMDLRKMFENSCPAKEYESTIAIQWVKRCFGMTLKCFSEEAKHSPKAIYFKLETSEDMQLSLLQTLQRIGQSSGEDTQCIFAFDRKPDIPEGQCHLKILVA